VVKRFRPLAAIVIMGNGSVGRPVRQLHVVPGVSRELKGTPVARSILVPTLIVE
jgi:hypothetical protein